MAPKKQDAYDKKGAPLPEVRPNEYLEIAKFLASLHDIAHNTGRLRHTFTRLELNDIKKLEFECNLWRVQMLQQPVEATTLSRQATQPPRQALSSASGQGDALALADVPAASTSAAPTTPGSPTSTAATEVIVVNDPIQILPREAIPGPRAVTNVLEPNLGTPAPCPLHLGPGGCKARRSLTPTPHSAWCRRRPRHRTANRNGYYVPDDTRTPHRLRCRRTEQRRPGMARRPGPNAQRAHPRRRSAWVRHGWENLAVCPTLLGIAAPLAGDALLVRLHGERRGRILSARRRLGAVVPLLRKEVGAGTAASVLAAHDRDNPDTSRPHQRTFNVRPVGHAGPRSDVWSLLGLWRSTPSRTTSPGSAPHRGMRVQNAEAGLPGGSRRV